MVPFLFFIVIKSLKFLNKKYEKNYRNIAKKLVKNVEI